MRIFEKQRLATGAGEVFFNKVKSSIDAAAVAAHWLAARHSQVLEHPIIWISPPQPNYYSHRVKKELADLTLSSDVFKIEWVTGGKTFTAANSAAVVWP